MKDFKQKLTAAVNHVKKNPIPYTIIATATACAVVETVYFQTHDLVNLNKVAKEMEKTGKGIFYAHKETGKVIILKLAHIADLARD